MYYFPTDTRYKHTYKDDKDDNILTVENEEYIMHFKCLLNKSG